MAFSLTVSGILAQQSVLSDAPTAKHASQMASTEQIFSWCTDLTKMGPRRPGTEAGRNAQAYMKSRFEEMGLQNVRVIPSKTTLWLCDSHSLTVDGEAVSSYPIAHTCNSGQFGKFNVDETAEIVYLGKGSKRDFRKQDVKGKIVVCDIHFTDIPVWAIKLAAKFVYDPGKTLPSGSKRRNPYEANNFPYNYYRAMEAGAAGFIGILEDYIDSDEYNNEDYSYIGGDMRLPGLWMRKSEGHKLIRHLKEAKSPVKATMRLDGSLTQVEAGAVIGYLQGKSDETIMVQSHYDSSTPGAVEDASGCAVLLAMADYYAKIPTEERERTLLFIAMDSHFSDYDTHDAVLRELFQPGHRIVANLCVEHIASELVENADGSLALSGEVEPRIFFFRGSKAMKRIVKEEIVRHNLDRSIIIRANIFGDDLMTDADEFYQQGLPVVNLISGPIYLYDNIDTIDKVAKEALRPTALAMSDILYRIMRLDGKELPKYKVTYDINQASHE